MSTNYSKLRKAHKLLATVSAVVIMLLPSVQAQTKKEVPADPMAWAKVSKAQEAAAKKLGVPVALTNSLGMRFALYIPPNAVDASCLTRYS